MGTYPAKRPFLALSLFTVAAYSIATSAPVLADETICVKNSQKISKGRVALKRAIKRVQGACPRGYGTLISTDELVGAQGLPGADGQNGRDGTDGISGYEPIEHSEVIALAANGGTGFASVDCPTGKVVFGGGCSASFLAIGMHASAPAVNGTRWRCGFTNRSVNPLNPTVTVYAVCGLAQ